MAATRLAVTPETPHDKLPLLPHPNLLVDAAELERLREMRRTSPSAQAVFDAIVRTADGYMDPSNPDHPDWQTLKDPRWSQRAGLNLATNPIEPCAFVYAMTGDRKYAQFAKDLVFTVIRKKIADQPYQMKQFGSTEPYPGWRHNATHDFGKLALSFGIFFDLCHDALSADERREFVDYARECLAIMASMRAEIGRMGLNNRGVRCAIGNAMLAMAIHGESGVDAETVRYPVMLALRLTGAYCTFAFGIDGGSFEGASYCFNTSVWIANFGRACERRGLRNLYRHPHLRKMCDFTFYNLTPMHDQLLPINDCFPDVLPTGALVASTVHRNGVYRWLYRELRAKLVPDSYKTSATSVEDFLYHDENVAPVHPRDAGYPLAKHFRDRGVVSMLSDWSDTAAQAIFFCGPQVYGGHRQDDQNAFTFCALGDKFAWDGGYDDFAGVLAGRAYRRSEYHNTILIDGRGQNGYDGNYWPRGHITAYEHDDNRTYVCGDASRCYGIDGSIERFDRHLHFQRAGTPYLLVVDDLIADDFEHEFTWNFVAHPHATIEPLREGVHLVKGRKAAMELHVLPDAPISWRRDMAGNMPRLQATVRGKRARFAALLLPGGGGTLSASFDAERTSATIAVADQTAAFVFPDSGRP